MKTNKLVPMTQFILDIDWMTTKEFCETYKIPLPTVTCGVNDFLQVDAIKQKMFVEYAKFLNMDLREDMFTGENPIFPDFVKCTQKYAVNNNILKSFDDFGKNEFSITMYRNYDANGVKKTTFVTSYRIKKVEQLATFGLLYNER